MKTEISRISHEQQAMKDKIKVSEMVKNSKNLAETFQLQENAEKIKVFKVLPYLVSNVIEVSSIRY